MADIERSVPEFRGGNERYLYAKYLADLLVDALDAVLYNYVPDGSPSPNIDRSYGENSIYWHDAMAAQHFEGMRIQLEGFHLSEWIPSAPGRYYTPAAEASREAVKPSEVEIWHYEHGSPERNYLLPVGKQYLLLGGVGCIRLAAKSVGENTFYFLGASSSGIAHQGISIAVTEQDYRKVFGIIKANGGCLANIIGSRRILPRSMALVQYDKAIPKYCLTADEVEVIRPSNRQEVLATVAISFPSSYHHQRVIEVNGRRIEPGKSWSFCSFRPSLGEDGLASAVRWLSSYAREYSGQPNPQILSDFDEHYEHFKSPVEFGLKDITRSHVDIDILQAYSQFLPGITVNVEKIEHHAASDIFQNISNSTIISRSVVGQSYNKIRETYGSDTATALVRIAEEIQRAGNDNAAQLFAAFNKELDRPEPRKPLLRALWEGITKAAPTIAQLSEVAVSIVKLFS